MATMAKIENVEAKKPVVEEIKNVLDGAQGVVLVDSRGLTVAEDTELRKTLREAGITYGVYKNTMIKLAIKGTANESLVPNLEGPSAIAVSKTEATAPAREICKFAKAHQKLEIKAGTVEGNYVDAKGVQNIADIPSREVLISKLLGSLQSPIANIARVLKQIGEQKEA